MGSQERLPRGRTLRREGRRNNRMAVKYVWKDRVRRWGQVGASAVPLEIVLLLQVYNCERVVKLIDWFEEQDCFILVMEKPDNSTDLFDYISERGVLREETAKEIFKNVKYFYNLCFKQQFYCRPSKQ